MADREDAALLVQLAQWGSAMGIEEAQQAVWADTFDPEAATVDDILVVCEQAGVDLRLARVKADVRAVLERDGTLGRLGADRLHGNVHGAVEAQLGH